MPESVILAGLGRTLALVVDVVIPVLNEASALPALLAAMPVGYRAIVVDNASTDGSGDIAEANGALVVLEPRRGFGAACAAGVEAATADVVCFMDGDGSLDPAELPAVVAALSDGASLVLGARTPTAAGAWPAHARLANRFLAARLRRHLGLTITDIGPMRAARRADLIALNLEDRRFGYPLEMVVRAAQAKWAINEIPVAYAPRVGRSKVTGTVRGTARAIADMRSVLKRAAC